MKRRPVAVLGATGFAGRQALVALARHPWFEIAAVAGSAASAGRRLGDVLAERADAEQDVAALLAAPAVDPPPAPLPDALLDLTLQDLDRFEAASVDAVFSMLPSSVAKEVEPRCAASAPVFSTASSHRMAEGVPLLLAGVNGEHAELLDGQRRARGWKGFLAPGPNCTVVALAVTLAPLQRAFGVRSVVLTSLQAVSGSGARAPAVAAAVAGNVLPFIAHEEEKVEQEAQKILARVQGGRLVPAAFPVSATCTRVPVQDGHLLSISVGLAAPAGPGDAAAVLQAENPFGARALPSRPARWIEVREEDDRPQPLLDRCAGGGYTTVVGRLRREPVSGGLKYLALSHNTVLGAAGGSVLLAEDLAERGLF